MAINKVKKIIPGEPEKIIPQKPDRIVEAVEGVKCDLCGQVSNEAGSWSQGLYETDEITVSRRHGEQYPEGGSVKEESYHVCPNCWENKLKPFFAKFGADPTIEDCSW